jgi:hypothetical protein
MVMSADEKRPFDSAADTFFGLERIVTGRVEMLAHMMNAARDLTENGFARTVAKKRNGGKHHTYEVEYPHVFLADTFFSDTLFAQDLLQIFGATKAHGVPCQIMFLNPFSDQARVRAMMLGAEDARRLTEQHRPLPAWQERALEASDSWAQIERNRKRRAEGLDAMLPITLRRSLTGLENLDQALNAAHRSARAAADSGANLPADDREVRQQLAGVLKHLRELRPKLKELGLDVEVKFTSDLLLLPIYILGPYVYRGFLMPRSSAVSKPWSIYRDDPARTDDMFELTKEAFEQAWAAAVSLEDMAAILEEDGASKRRSLMVAYSEDNKWALDQVVRVMGDLNRSVSIERFPMASKSSDVSRDTVLGMLDRSSAGIALMLADEEIESRRRRDGEIVEAATHRSRPNVIHELGLMQGRYGFDRVLLLMADDERPYERPANLAGVNEARVQIDWRRQRMSDDQLRGVLLTFFEQLGF